MKIASIITDLVGKTPLLEISRFSSKEGALARIFAKLEYFNPAGSVKDRVALNMVEQAEKDGLLSAGATIIEPTSGNTGVGLAMVCAVKGYNLILTMPETMSVERQKLLKAYGAKIELTSGAQGMQGAIDKALELRESISGAVILQQFENSANPAAHYKTTAREIIEDTDGKIDVFVSAVGTGGTISGTAKALKEFNPNIYVVAVEPAESAVLSGGEKGSHKIQGIGAGFVPAIYDASVVDEVVTVSGDDAMQTSRELAKTEGILVGISSGAAACAAARIAMREEFAGKNVVCILPDTGERYLSTELYV
jgi:cysteine synthase A